ncbi:hypothetical protein SLS62_006786 [Diatrype stigma]|uniref:DUF6594 domain-containing protein n=1 Tax=Diatrype stigma TaxID=117547 RepID=A0AAN9UNR9_9PEZI
MATKFGIPLFHQATARLVRERIRSVTFSSAMSESDKNIEAWVRQLHRQDIFEVFSDAELNTSYGLSSINQREMTSKAAPLLLPRQWIGMFKLILRIRNAVSHKVRSQPSNLEQETASPAAVAGAGVHVKLNLAGLHRMRMRKLQMKLARVILHMRYGEEEPAGWERLLDEYIDAVRHHDFIRSCVDRGLQDPFVVLTQRRLDADVLQGLLREVPRHKRIPDGLHGTSGAGHPVAFGKPLEKEPQAIGGTRYVMSQRAKFEAFRGRLAMALVGGAFLVGPMWLMVLRDDLYTSLVSTSAFVFAWGLVMAWRLDRPMNVLAVTAAYAAVLVVFVGSNPISS